MKCSFCGGKLPQGRGKLYAKTTGQVFYFCNSKCERNWQLGRDGKRVKWTGRAREKKS